MISFNRLVALCSALATLVHATPSPAVPRLRTDVHMFNHGGLTANSDAAKANKMPTSETDKVPTILDNPALKLDETARDILSRATPAAPHFVIYGDRFVAGDVGPPPVSAIRGYNVFALSFLLTSGPFDKAAEWATLTDAQRDNVKAQYAAAGIKLIASAFGSTETPTTSRTDPIGTANTMAAFIKRYKLDGIDVDYEDLQAFNARNGLAEQWLTDFTRQLRTQLPQNQFILTHAPLAPWFSPSNWTGGYLRVHQNVGNLIDWYNIQFYNQGTNEYTDCNGLLSQSSGTWPQTAIFQIAANGVPANKLVIGKPGSPADATNGYMAPQTLAGCVQQARQRGWDAGVMVWQYPNADASWISTVRSAAFPV